MHTNNDCRIYEFYSIYSTSKHLCHNEEDEGMR